MLKITIKNKKIVEKRTYAKCPFKNPIKKKIVNLFKELVCLLNLNLIKLNSFAKKIEYKVCSDIQSSI